MILEQYARQKVIKPYTKFECTSSKYKYKSTVFRSCEKQAKIKGFWGGFRIGDGRISFLEQYAQQFSIISHHTKFELSFIS